MVWVFEEGTEPRGIPNPAELLCEWSGKTKMIPSSGLSGLFDFKKQGNSKPIAHFGFFKRSRLILETKLMMVELCLEPQLVVVQRNSKTNFGAIFN